jgi:DNA-binding transcriptional LysR family regulator
MQAENSQKRFALIQARWQEWRVRCRVSAAPTSQEVRGGGIEDCINGGDRGGSRDRSLMWIEGVGRDFVPPVFCLKGMTQKNTMKWDDLRIYLAVARQSRLMSAGRSLGLDPATVGRRITALEDALGTKLFDRSPQGYAMTEAGRSLLVHAQAMEAQASAASEEVGGRSDSLSGIVRIGAPDGVSNYLLVDACDALSRDNPDLQVQAVALPRMFSLSKREADLAITVSPPSAGRLTVRKIADYRLRLYARSDVVAAAGPVRGLDDLHGVRGIGYISDMIFDKELDYYSLLGRESEPALTSNSLIMQLRWCLRGCGLCILPDFVAQEHAELEVVLPEEIRLMRAFYLVRHQDDARVARVNRMADVIVEWMRSALVPEGSARES